MNCLIIGGSGQLGRALQAVAPPGAQVLAPSRQDCDLANFGQIAEWLRTTRPDVVFNAAAYTAVDAAEADTVQAEFVNADAVAHLAKVATEQQAKLIHISTDFVFDGASGTPYVEGAATNPLSTYGRSKLRGEIEAAKAAHALIVRTSWVYAEHGRNFAQTMLSLMKERQEVRVVADQIGSPTYARNLAEALWSLVMKSAEGMYHYTDSGVASWYDFAQAIQEEALAVGILSRSVSVIPIPSTDYPTPAKRPHFSVLDKSKAWAALGSKGQHWRSALRQMLNRMDVHG